MHAYGGHRDLAKHMEIVRHNHVWGGDITYAQVQREFLYLAALMDLFTRVIRGRELGRHLAKEPDPDRTGSCIGG